MDDKLGVEEFRGELLSRVSKKIVSRTYLAENDEFVSAMSFDLFQQYLEGGSIDSLSEVLESVFYNLFFYQPKLFNSAEVIDTENY